MRNWARLQLTWRWAIVLGLTAAKVGLVQAADIAKLKIPNAAQLEKSIERGIYFLLEDQNRDGSWGTARNTKDLNIFAPVPGAHHAFRCGVTALCVEALIDSGLVSHD